MELSGKRDDSFAQERNFLSTYLLFYLDCGVMAVTVMYLGCPASQGKFKTFDMTVIKIDDLHGKLLSNCDEMTHFA